MKSPSFTSITSIVVSDVRVVTECMAWRAAQYGRNALAEITREVDGKSEEEVRAYAKAFWERHKELNEWDKVIKNIERGEQRIQRQKARASHPGGVMVRQNPGWACVPRPVTPPS